MSTIILGHTFTHLGKTWWSTDSYPVTERSFRALIPGQQVCFSVFKLSLNNKTINSEAWQPSVASGIQFCHYPGRIVVYSVLQKSWNLFTKKSDIPADDGAQLFRFVYCSIPLCILCWLRLLQAGIYAHFGYITMRETYVNGWNRGWFWKMQFWSPNKLCFFKVVLVFKTISSLLKSTFKKVYMVGGWTMTG